jgi:CBS domain-containing protein
MKVVDVMTKEVVTVPVTASLKDVAALLVEHGISGLPVVDESRCVLGVVSEADILMKERTPPVHSLVFATLHPSEVLEEELRGDARSAGEAMTTPPIVIDPNRPLAEAATLMLEFKVNRLPVVEDERLVGIVTRADLVRAFTRSDEELEREIREDVVLQSLWIDPTRIGITVRNGYVTLRGTVETRTTAELLPGLVARVPGVVSVVSNLAVERGAR